MINLEYLELIPVPDDLIADIYDTIKNTPIKDRHAEPKNTDAEQYPAWNSFKASDRLKTFIKTLFDFEHDVHIFYLTADIPAHKDNTRDTAYNYVIETGNANTNFYTSDGILLEEHKIEPLRWHKLNVSQHHAVLIPNGPRILVSVSMPWTKDSSK
jgi:hypothetical protein